jgi:hypothetical protein
MVAFPFGSIAWRANVLTALFSSGAGTVIFLIAVLLTSSSAAGVLAVALFSFTRLTWCV